MECILEQILAKKEPHKGWDLHSFKTKDSRNLKSKTGTNGFIKGSNWKENVRLFQRSKLTKSLKSYIAIAHPSFEKKQLSRIHHL